MRLLEFFESVGGLLLGIGTFIVGACMLWARLRQLRERIRARKKKEGEKVRIPRSQLWTSALGITLIVVSGCIFVGRAVIDLPLNAQLTSQAWAALDVKAHERAVALAGSCISKFGGSAELQQEALRESKAPAPPTGKVSAEQRADIFSRGLLNDVATCYFIRGEALVALGRTREAIQAYERTRSYTYARCWDPQGWFWSPASAAEGRLRLLPVPPESTSSESSGPAN